MVPFRYLRSRGAAAASWHRSANLDPHHGIAAIYRIASRPGDQRDLRRYKRQVIREMRGVRLMHWFLLSCFYGGRSVPAAGVQVIGDFCIDA